MAAKFVLKTAANGQYMFNLVAGNGEIILTGVADQVNGRSRHGQTDADLGAEAARVELLAQGAHVCVGRLGLAVVAHGIARKAGADTQQRPQTVVVCHALPPIATLLRAHPCLKS